MDRAAGIDVRERPLRGRGWYGILEQYGSECRHMSASWKSVRCALSLFLIGLLLNPKDQG